MIQSLNNIFEHVDSPFKSPSVLSICPGFRGLERGLERAIGGIRVLTYVEIEAVIIANLVAAMEAGVLAPCPIWSNVKTFNANIIRRKIDAIVGGYPCQSFSYAGKRQGQEDPRYLWPSIRSIIRTGEPIWCFFENVPGHIDLGYDQVYKDLRSMDYVVESGIYSAEEVGAPQERDRFFILSIKLEYATSGWARKLRDAISEREGYGLAGTGTVLQRTGPEEEQADTNCIGRSHRESEIDSAEGGEYAFGHAAAGSVEELADTLDTGLQRGKWGQSLSGEGTSTYGSITERREDVWPARPGEEQYEWEAPRTSISGVDFSIAGYNFREDLVRAAGNMVVEQTAEVAFLDLLGKHLKNIT